MPEIQQRRFRGFGIAREDQLESLSKERVEVNFKLGYTGH